MDTTLCLNAMIRATDRGDRAEAHRLFTAYADWVRRGGTVTNPDLATYAIETLDARWPNLRVC